MISRLRARHVEGHSGAGSEVAPALAASSPQNESAEDSPTNAGAWLASVHGAPRTADRATTIEATRRVVVEMESQLRRLYMLPPRASTVDADVVEPAAVPQHASLRPQFSSSITYLASRYGFELPLLDDATSSVRAHEIMRHALSTFAGVPAQNELECFLVGYDARQRLTLQEWFALPHMARIAVLQRAVAEREGGAQDSVEPPLAGLTSYAPDVELARIAQIDWNDLTTRSVRLGPADTVFLTERSGCYVAMDLSTRQHYCNEVLRFASLSGSSEEQVAYIALQLADERASSPDTPEKQRHVGYYLFDQGMPEFERLLGERAGTPIPPPRPDPKRRASQFLTGMAVATAIGTTVLLALMAPIGPALLFVPFTALLAVIVSEQVQDLWMRYSLANVDAKHTPSMNFGSGVPAHARTLVAVPSLLGDAGMVSSLCAIAERHHLANPDPNIRVALLTDFSDAHAQVLPQDAALLDQAREAIDALNAKYADARGGPFLLLHRPRQWNAAQGRWIGRERKRGKLEDLNALLLHDRVEPFSEIVGDRGSLAGTRYVITVDADTETTPGCANKLIAAMHHPLNRATLDPRTGLFASGYGIIIPAVSQSLLTGHDTIYCRVLHAMSTRFPYPGFFDRDVFYDVFDTTSFSGKGIYSVEAVATAFDGRFPDNRILSHDIIEGQFARTAFLDTVNLREPCAYSIHLDVQRAHRWTRGDLQNAAWILPRIPHRTGEGIVGRTRNPLPALSRWILFWVIARAYVPTCQTLLFLMSWFFLPRPGIATLLIVVSMIAAGLGYAFVKILQRLKFTRKAIGPLMDATNSALKVLMYQLVMMPTMFAMGMDAAARVIWRLFVSKALLLEWRSSGETTARQTLGGYVRFMWLGPTLAGVVAIALALTAPFVLVVAAPVLLAWFFGPAVAWLISREMGGKPYG